MRGRGFSRLEIWRARGVSNPRRANERENTGTMVARTHETIIAGYAKELAVFARPALISDATQLIGLNKCFRSDTIPAPQKNPSVAAQYSPGCWRTKRPCDATLPITSLDFTPWAHSGPSCSRSARRERAFADGVDLFLESFPLFHLSGHA